MDTNLSDYNSIINLSEQLCNIAPDFDVIELEEKTQEYLKAVEQYFVKLDKHELTQNNFEDIKEIISVHKTITSSLKTKKEEISTNLKQLHTGKEMQNTYPKKMY